MDQTQAALKVYWFDRVSELASSNAMLTEALRQRDVQIADLKTELEKHKVPEPATAEAKPMPAV